MWSKPPFIDPGPESNIPPEASQEKDVHFLRKGRRNKWMGNRHGLKTNTRGNIKFRPLDDNDSSDSDAEAGHVSKGDTDHVKFRPRLAGTNSATSTHSSTPTVLEESMHSHVGRKDLYCVVSPTHPSAGLEGSDLPDYSDHEVDITSDLRSIRHDPSWIPRFLQNQAQLPKPDSPHTDQVLSGTGWHGSSRGNSRASSKRQENPRWQAFWRDVNEKIQHKEIS